MAEHGIFKDQEQSWVEAEVETVRKGSIGDETCLPNEETGEMEQEPSTSRHSACALELKNCAKK